MRSSYSPSRPACEGPHGSGIVLRGLRPPVHWARWARWARWAAVGDHKTIPCPADQLSITLLNNTAIGSAYRLVIALCGSFRIRRCTIIQWSYTGIMQDKNTCTVCPGSGAATCQIQIKTIPLSTLHVPRILRHLASGGRTRFEKRSVLLFSLNFALTALSFRLYGSAYLHLFYVPL